MKILLYKLYVLSKLRKLSLIIKHNKSKLTVLLCLCIFCLFSFNNSEKLIGIDLNPLIPIIILILSLLNLMNGTPLLKIDYQKIANKCISFRYFKIRTIISLIVSQLLIYILLPYIFYISSQTESVLRISLTINYSISLFSIMQYDFKHPNFIKAIILVISVTSFTFEILIGTFGLALLLTIIWLTKKNYPYNDLLEFFQSYAKLREGLLTSDNSEIQNAQGEMFDKKSKSSYSLFKTPYRKLITCYIKYEFTYLFRKGKSLVSLYISNVILYMIIYTLNLPSYFMTLLLFFSIGSLQLFITNLKVEENIAIENGYYLKYPMNYFILSKYVSVLSAYTLPSIFYFFIFNFNSIILLMYFYVPLQITLSYKIKSKLVNLLLYIPILLMLNFIN